MSHCLVVLGPYRSGTSLAAQILARLGVDFGPAADLIATNRFNPGGYLERGDLNALNRALVTSAGGALGAPGDPESLARRADRSILDGASLPWPDHAPLWGLKDPRFCATLSIWIDSNRLHAESIRLVRLVRNTESIVQSSLEHPSVRRFCRGDEEAARRMVGDYNALADWQIRTTGLPAHRLIYEELLDDPTGAIGRLADWLEFDEPGRIRNAVRCVGKRSALRRFRLRRSLTLPVRAVRKACRLAAGAANRSRRG